MEYYDTVSRRSLSPGAESGPIAIGGGIGVLRNYLSLAVRNAAHAKLYVAISVVGLTIGFAASILIALYVHDEFSYDAWIPGSEQIFQVSARGAGDVASGVGPSDLGQWIASDYPQLQAVTRIFVAPGVLARGNDAFNESIAWSDPSVFGVFRFPVVSGSLDGALSRPGTLVLTRKIAEKYFGDEDAVGKTLLYDKQHEMVVTAVIENLPSSTHFDLGVIGAGISDYSPAAEQDRSPMRVFGSKLWNSQIYFLTKPGEPIEPLRASIATLLDRHAPTPGKRKASEIWPLAVRPIRALHLSTGVVSAPDAEDLGEVYAVAAIGLLVVLVAAINFVNLFTALGARRALAVGVRKVLGARRRDLFLQFMSESFLYVAIAALAGLGLAAAGLKPLNAFLLRTIDLSFLLDVRFVAGAVLFLAAVALLAGLYPAMVLSSFRPATVTKAPTGGRAQAATRQTLVVLQFAILIALLIATTVTYRQTSLGLREGLRQNTDPIVLLRAPCTDAIKAEMRKVPGVLETACTQGLPQRGTGMISPITVKDQPPFGIRYLSLGIGFFELFGLKPVAGRFFSPDLGTDVSPTDNVWKTPEALVINEAAVKRMGFSSPAAAVGQTVTFAHLFRMPVTFAPPHAATIIGVVENFQVGSVREEIPPAAFYVDPAQAQLVGLKLNGRSTPEALAGIDRVWAQSGTGGPPARFFFQDTIEQMYLDLRRQTELFSVFAGIAVLIAVLGLVGLAAHAAVSRTKEIGIRKALGGSRGAITELLLWQFSKPVLLANAIAWPVAYYAMSRWLQGFAQRVGLDAWMFVAAGALTLAVAILAVLLQTWGMAGVRPVQALRYE